MRDIASPLGGLTSPLKRQTRGRELLQVGDFASDTVWTKGTGWTIAGGVASRPPQAAASSITQAIPLIEGARYRVVFTITAIPAGNARARFTGGTVVDGIARSTTGTFTEDFIALAGNTTFAISANTAATDVTVDNVSVFRVFV